MPSFVLLNQNTTVHITDVKKITLTEQVADEYKKLGKEGRFSKKCIP